MKKSLIILLSTLCCITATAQELPLGKEEILFDVANILPANIDTATPSQGFAIYGRYAFSMHDKGQCVIFDLKHRKYINSFILEGNTGHCNNASFGNERYSRKSQFPLFYVTECRGERACYVNDISLEGSRLVQKIFYDGKEITGPCDWLVDAERDVIYLYCTIGKTRMMKWFPLPRLADSDSRGEVHLKPEQALGLIPAGDITIPQGNHKYRHMIFLPDGIPPRPTRLHITNARSGKNMGIIPLAEGLEPEGVATHKGWLYLSYHTPRASRHNIISRFKIKRKAD